MEAEGSSGELRLRLEFELDGDGVEAAVRSAVIVGWQAGEGAQGEREGGGWHGRVCAEMRFRLRWEFAFVTEF